MEKSIAFLYTGIEQMKLKIKKKTSTFTILPKMRYLDINISKFGQNIFSENYKTLTRAIINSCL